VLSNPQNVTQSLHGSRFFRFLLSGGIAALFNFGSRFFYNLFVDFSTAVVLAFFSGITAGYLLNKRYVFTSSRNSVAQEITWFVLVNLFALAQTWGMSVYLAHMLPGYLHFAGARSNQLADAIAHGTGVLLPVFTSYIGHKYLTFRE